MKKSDTRKALPDFTKGPIIKALISLSIPIVFANILQTAYQLVDTFWVGRLGAEAVAAVSLSFPFLFLLISLAGGLAIAGTIMVSQYKGKGDIEQVDYISAQTLMMMFIVGIIVSIIGYFLSAPLMHFMGAEGDVLPAATSYLQISFVGLVFMFGFFIYQSLMRGVGDVKTPLFIVFGTVLLNLVLDPLFILGWGPIPAYGVTGAALATIGTQGLATIIGIALLMSGKQGIHLKASNMKPDFSLMKKMFFLGFPASISQSTRALGMMLMTFLVASFGTVVVASYGIGGRILSFIIIPAVGLAMATSTLVGQNIGAGKIDRAAKISKTSSLISFALLSAVGVLVFLFAEPLTAAFIPDDTEVIQSGSQFVKIMALTFGFIGIQQTINGTLMGSGNTKMSMILSLITLFIVQFPFAYILSKHTTLGFEGIYWAFPITNIIMAIGTVIWFSKGSWKKKNITEDPTIGQVVEETIIEEGAQ
ncbi:MATE family efflux transporter [Candidatus Peregrinibacteria bacterium]|nr:MATE family efflux transporter [Candidatus Peregrinibacteria bacterium]